VVGKEAEDLTRHDKWLCMMYPRLKLLHKLLAEDGAIFISIDDNEQANLKLMMDEIFGGGNFIANIIWQKAFSPVNLRKTFSSNHDFVVVFCKNQMNFSMNGLQRREDDLKRKNSIILDSFAGSGTTAHAVLNLNKQDGGNRKFILIEMEEYAETITAERVKRVINGYADKEGTGGSFDYYELGQALFNEDNEINELVGVKKLRQYIYYTETKLNIEKHNYKDNEYLLNKHNDTAYYFFYEQDWLPL
jgi:adenine specific DNA methylase Mod